MTNTDKRELPEAITITKVAQKSKDYEKLVKAFGQRSWTREEKADGTIIYHKPKEQETPVEKTPVTGDGYTMMDPEMHKQFESTYINPTTIKAEDTTIWDMLKRFIWETVLLYGDQSVYTGDCDRCTYVEKLNKEFISYKRMVRIAIIVVTICLLIRHFEEPIRFELGVGRDVFAIKTTWWGLKDEIYPVKHYAGQWHIKNSKGKWVPIIYDDEPIPDDYYKDHRRF